MLKDIRKSVHGVFTKVLLSLIIISFVSFYGYRNISSCHPSAVAKVGSNLITDTEYMTRLQSQTENYRRILGREIDDSMMAMVKKSVLEQLINRHLMLSQAKIADLNISDNAVVDEIHRSFSDPKTNNFDPEFYKKYVMRYMHMSPHKFEEQVRGNLLATKFQGIFSSAAKISKDEIAEQSQFENRQMNIEFASLDPKAMPVANEPADSELLAYYNKHQAEYQSEAQRKVDYLYLDPSDHGALTNKTKSSKDPVTAPDPAVDEKLKKLAEQIYGKLKSTPTLPLKEASGDIKSHVGTTGFFAKQSTLPDIKDSVVVANRAFLMKVNEVSEPVKGWLSGGYYLIRVTAELAPKPLSFAEAKNQLRVNYLEEGNTKRAEEYMDKALAELKSGKTFSEIAKNFSMMIGETGLFKPAQAKTIPQIGFSNDIGKEIGLLSSSNLFVPRPLKVGGRYYLLKLKDQKTVTPEELASSTATEKPRLLASKQQESFMGWMRSNRERAEKKGDVAIYKTDPTGEAGAPDPGF
jgi:peptidyl-prolyl cis-trans isomerase D